MSGYKLSLLTFPLKFGFVFRIAEQTGLTSTVFAKNIALNDIDRCSISCNENFLLYQSGL